MTTSHQVPNLIRYSKFFFLRKLVVLLFLCVCVFFSWQKIVSFVKKGQPRTPRLRLRRILSSKSWKLRDEVWSFFTEVKREPVKNLRDDLPKRVSGIRWKVWSPIPKNPTWCVHYFHLFFFPILSFPLTLELTWKEEKKTRWRWNEYAHFETTHLSGLQEELVNLKDIPKSMAVFCLATYGEGDPTDNAMEFFEWLKNGDANLTGLNYAVNRSSAPLAI